MKTRMLASILILVLAVLITAGSCATMKSPDKMTCERFCGTWANKEYEPIAGYKPGVTFTFAKYIVNPDGTLLWYPYLDDAGPTAVGRYTVEKRWRDAIGNSLYYVKVYEFQNTMYLYELWKIDKHNMVWECNSSNIDYPDKIDPSDWHTSYRIFYRY
jgi:hypothetical protein